MSEELKKDKDSKTRKDALFLKMSKAFDDYIDGTILVVNVNSAGSFQLQKLRAALRDRAVLMMGKNTMIRKVLRERYFTVPEYQGLIPFLTGTIGLLFTRSVDVIPLAKLISKHTFVTLPAKEGMVATEDIFIPAGISDLDPTITCFFGAMNVPTKITRGKIEILADVKVANKGDTITKSMEIFFGNLQLKPFSRVVTVEAVYERGYVCSYAAYLRPRMMDPIQAFLNSVFRFAAISTALGVVNEATMPYLLQAFHSRCSLSDSKEEPPRSDERVCVYT